MITKRRFLSIACAGGLASVAPASWRPAHAQTVRGTARMLVGSPPGGSTDTVARLLASEMKGYASTIIVENRPGAGNRIALDVLKMSPADGTALTLTPASMLVIYPHIYKSLNYVPVTDFIPVSTVCSFPFLVTIGPRGREVACRVHCVVQGQSERGELWLAGRRNHVAFHRRDARARRRVRIRSRPLSGCAFNPGRHWRADRSLDQSDFDRAAPCAVGKAACAHGHGPATQRPRARRANGQGGRLSGTRRE